jgi:hypothetical protein
MIVADFSMNNGRENRTNGNQEKGKEEKEALRRSVESQKGTLKASPKFLCGTCRGLRLGPATSLPSSQDSEQDSERAFPGPGIIHGTRKNCSRNQA